MIEIIKNLGSSTLFLLKAILRRPRLKNSRFLIKQIYSIGVLSLPIILMAGAFVGMVLGLQGYMILNKYGAAGTTGQLVALSLARELGPVVSALLFAGRAGSALTAEIGLMKASEQLDSLEMMGVDPLGRIIAPRLWAGLFSLPLLNLIFIVIAIYGGNLVVVDWLSLDAGEFWGNMRTAVGFSADIGNGIIKSVVFGIVVTWIAVYQGYTAHPTPEGVNTATTKTVVYSSLAILSLDFILTALMFGH